MICNYLNQFDKIIFNLCSTSSIWDCLASLVQHQVCVIFVSNLTEKLVVTISNWACGRLIEHGHLGDERSIYIRWETIAVENKSDLPENIKIYGEMGTYTNFYWIDFILYLCILIFVILFYICMNNFIVCIIFLNRPNWLDFQMEFVEGLGWRRECWNRLLCCFIVPIIF